MVAVRISHPMKKTLMILSAVLVVIGVSAANSVAHNGNHGSSRAQIYRAQRLPVSSTPGPSLAVTVGTGATGATGSTASPGATGPVGRAQLVQNETRYNFGAHVTGLTAGGVYPVAIYLDVDGQGCASTSNTPLSPPAIPSMTADA